jgi:hypothetical protein
VSPTESRRLSENKCHFARLDGNVTSCGRYVFNNPVIRVTSDPAKVTCELCLKWLPRQEPFR